MSPLAGGRLQQPTTDFPIKVPLAIAEPGYLRQLDGLRAFAVLGVMASHFCRDNPLWYSNGGRGVTLFFAMSGFLITSILLRARREVEQAALPRSVVLKRFYIRRALRLLPLFYGVLFLTVLLDVETIRDTLPWHLLYASNIRFAITGAWEGSFSHFWTLAVEEQFYLLWPIFILFAPPRLLRPVIAMLVSAAIAFRTLGQPLGASEMAVWVLPPSHLSSLGLGALLAFHRSTGNTAPSRNAPPPITRLAPVALVTLLAVAALNLVYTDTPPTLSWETLWSLGDTAWTVFFTVLVWRATENRRDWLGRVLAWRPLVYLGRISYGMYVIHLFMPSAVSVVLAAIDIPPPESAAARYLVFGLATIALAAASWHWYELPINRFRHRLPYVSHTR